MNNLHVSLSQRLMNSSRLLKQTKSIASYQPTQKVYIAGVHEEGAASHEELFQADEAALAIVEIKRFRFSIGVSKALLLNVLRRLEFYLKVFWHYRDKKISMVNVHALELLPFGLLLKYLYRAKLIYDTHELETETKSLSGFKTDFRKKILRKVEKWCIKRVDQVFVVSESIADWYMGTYQIPRPVVLMNAPKLIDIHSKDHFRQVFNISGDAKIVLYQGLLSRARGIHLLLETFKLRQDKRIVLVIMGYGELEDSVKAVAESSENVFFHPAVPAEVVLEYSASADIGIACIENACLSYYYCMPNKLFEYSMVGLPVIVSCMKEMADFVHKYQIGVVFDEETVASINTAIEELLLMDFKQLKLNARRAAELNCWEKQESKMLAVYDELGYFMKNVFVPA